jgi:hypothetical protein
LKLERAYSTLNMLSLGEAELDMIM